MESDPKISFEDTAVAFEYKSDAELSKANFIFSLVNHPWVSGAATSATKLALKLHLPIEGIIKKTVFFHFCGGESIETSHPATEKLAQYGVQTILDYSVEGEKSEAGFDRTAEETLRTVEHARSHEHLPFCVFKVTGLAPFGLLEKVNRKETLTADEQQAWERVKQRMDRICGRAHQYGIPVLIDAEETWIQDAMDRLVLDLMKKIQHGEGHCIQHLSDVPHRVARESAQPFSRGGNAQLLFRGQAGTGCLHGEGTRSRRGYGLPQPDSCNQGGYRQCL
jgi:proline dehydrogenase